MQVQLSENVAPLRFNRLLRLMEFGSVVGLLLSKVASLALAGVCIALQKHHLIRWISYWYAALIAWNLCAILAGARCG